MAITYTRVSWVDGPGGGTPLSEANLNISEAGIAALYNLVNGKGELIVATAADTLERLAAGTNTHLLTADSAQGTGVKWALSPETDLVAAKGNLLAGTAADTLAALTVGANGTILEADFTQATGLKWSTGGPSFRAHRLTTVQVLGNGSTTKVQFNAEDWDTDACYDSTTNHRFLPTKAGIYRFSASIYISALVDAKRYIAYIYKNGSEAAQAVASTGKADDHTAQITTLLAMNGSTDYVEAFARQDDTTNRDIAVGSNKTWFAGEYVRPS